MNKRTTETEKRYIEQRKKNLKEEMALVYQRDLITKQIRDIRKDMSGWDRWLSQ